MTQHQYKRRDKRRDKERRDKGRRDKGRRDKGRRDCEAPEGEGVQSPLEEGTCLHSSVVAAEVMSECMYVHVR